MSDEVFNAFSLFFLGMLTATISMSLGVLLLKVIA